MPELSCADIVSILPSFEMGTALLEHYTQEVNWIYHILHIPTTIRMKDNIYSRLQVNQSCDFGELALLACLLAASAYFIPPPSTMQSLPISPVLRSLTRKDLLHCVHRWSQLAFHCLTQARYMAYPSICTIQAVIIFSHFLLPNEGATSTYCALLTVTINSARILAMHQVDSKKSIKEREDALRQGNKPDLVELQLKRRIWWHLTSSDWILAFFSG